MKKISYKIFEIETQVDGFYFEATASINGRPCLRYSSLESADAAIGNVKRMINEAEATDSSFYLLRFPNAPMSISI